MFDNKSYIATLKSVVVVDNNGDNYDSRTEYRFSELLDMAQVEYQHNKLALAIQHENGGMYKPDFTIERNINGIACIDAIDVKGKGFWYDKKAQQVAQLMINALGKQARGYGNILRSFALVFPKEIRYYDKTTKDIEGVIASFYKCPKCGKFEILPDDKHDCSYCGTESHKFCNDDWIQFVMSNADKPTLPHRSEWEINRREEIKELAEKANIKFLDRGDCFKIAFPTRVDVLWTPDFAYEIQPDSVKTYGSAKRLQALVSCIEDSRQYTQMIKYLCNHAANKESVIGQAVFITPNGIFIAERNDSQLKPGHAYHCSECGSGYFSADDDARCPFCGSYRHSIVED